MAGTHFLKMAHFRPTKSQNISKQSSLSPDSLTSPLDNLKLGPTENADTAGHISPRRNKYSRYSPQNSRAVSSRSNRTRQSQSQQQPRNAGVVARKAKGNIACKPAEMLVPKGYTCRPIIPADRAELLPVAQAMHREDFAPRVKKLFDPEREAAIEAIECGVYIGWRIPSFKHDCIRVGSSSKCFCGHVLLEHADYNGHSVRVPCGVTGCKCKAFTFVPARAEEVGEWWLQRRRNFDPKTWRAKCKCRHTHEEHVPTGMRQCRVRNCGCGRFFSDFLCCACDKHWEEHETVFETEKMRKEEGIPYGEAYLPFNELPELRNVVLTGEMDDDSQYRALTSGRYAIPDSRPTDLALQLRGQQPSHRSPFE